MRPARRAALILALAMCIGLPAARPAIAGDAAAADPSAHARALAREIDRLVEARWVEAQAVASDAVDDAAFMRRVSLDIAGRIPNVAELREFLADESPDKRALLVERLLDSPGYIMHFSSVWRSVMMPEAESNLEARFFLPAFEAWMRRRLSDNTPYDTLVREILTVSVDPRNAMNPYQTRNQLTPVSYFQSKQLKPENLAAGTARMFLGVRIECAQCHDHPFDDWKREQFWSYAAFFAGLERDPSSGTGLVNSIRELFDRRDVVIPGTNTVVKPLFLDGREPKLRFRASAREALADWLVSRENPYFARSAVNRLWGHFFGVGLVDPVDDFTLENPASHPELLELLARAFAENGFDLKFLTRALTSSRAYQLSSARTHPSQDDGRLFARMALKGLSPEQIFDSIAQATGFYEPYTNRNPFAMGGNTPREEFVQVFDNNRDTITERTTTILQALAMMNGQFVSDATSLDRSATLAAVAEFPLMTTAERVEALFLAALSRPPRDEEVDRLTRFVDGGGPAVDPKRALGDVFWALLNSSEFLFNR